MPTPWGRRFRAERKRSNTRKGARGEHIREPSTLFPPPFVNCPLINCLKCTTENVFLHENYVEVYILANTERFEKVPIEKLVPYIRNARTHSKEQILQIRASLREFGFVTPVIIDEKYTVIAGHGRIMAAKEEGITEIPCVFAENLTEAQKKAYILADNRLAMNAGWRCVSPRVHGRRNEQAAGRRLRGRGRRVRCGRGTGEAVLLEIR